MALNFLKLDGTQSTKFQLEATGSGPQLKSVGGNLVVRNAADAADATVTASEFLASGNVGLVINSDSAGSGADWKISLARPTSGMTADWTMTLPPNAGSSGQVLQTNGSGVTTWVNSSSGATDITIETDLAFGDTSTVAIGTLPAGATITSVQFVVDTAWDDVPSMSVGISSDHSKYMGAGDNLLTEEGGWAVSPNLPPDVSSEALVIYYTAAASTVGAGRLLITYF